MEHPWSVSVRLDEVPEMGRHLDLEPSAEVRAALAKPLGVDAIERLRASFDLARRGRDGLHVTGQVRATVRQTCVVTLEPVTNEIDEPIEVEFAAPSDIKNAVQAIDPEDLDVASSSPDEPEPLVGNSVDLGVLATEFLTLGVDPYPRKPDAEFAAPAADGTSAHPFAALSGWSKKGTVKE